MPTFVNPTTTPTVYSEDGRALGAGERLEIDELDPAGQAALERGALVEAAEVDAAGGEEPAGVTPARRSRKGAPQVP